MRNLVNKYFIRFFLIVPVIVLIILAFGCGSPVKNEKPVEPEVPIIEKDTLVKMHRAFNHFSKAGLYEISGNLEKAADEYSLALYYDPTSMELKRLLADINFQLKRYGEVLDFVEKLEQPTVDDLILAADCYRLNGNIDRAAEYYIRVSDMDSTLDFPGNFLANYHTDKKEYSKAEDYYRRLINNSENSDAWRLELASFYIKIGKTEKAIDIYNEMIARDSLDNRGYLGIAAVREMEDDSLAADSLYKFLAYKNWDEAQILNIISQSFIRLGDFDMAIEVTGRISELYPEDYFAKRRYALLLFTYGDKQKADSALADLSTSVEYDPIIYYYRGRIAQLDENYSRAESMYVQAIAINDTLTEAWIYLAFTRHLLDDFEQTLATFDSALVKCPGDSLDLFYYKGMSFSREEKFAEAVEYYLKILKAEPENIGVIFNLGAAYERIKDFDKSEEMFLGLLDIRPDHAMTLNYLGYMYADMGINLNQAEKMIKKALEFAPDNSAYLDSYAWVMYKKEKYKDALKYQLKALEGDSKDALLFEHMGDIYFALKKITEAKYHWNKALELDPENESVKEKLKY